MIIIRREEVCQNCVLQHFSKVKTELTEWEGQSLSLDLLQYIWAAVCIKDHERRRTNPLI